MARVRQPLDDTRLDDLGAAVQGGLQGIVEALDGASVCILAGSRGIDRYAEVVAAVVAAVRRAGGIPFVTPAMGSHGGATADGQRDVLARLGVTEASVGCPIRAGMDVVALGDADGVPVHVDALARAADAIIPVNRVKPHTGFTGAIESGLSKMLAIGLSNREGAHAFHSAGYDAFATLIPAVAAHTTAALSIPCGVAILENGHGRLARVEVVPGNHIANREPELLAEARDRMGRLPLTALDVLVVDRIGKDVSGVGMDPNVIGRDHRGRRPGPPHIQRIVVRGLTEATAGHAAGIGMADIVLERVVSAIDWHKTVTNSLTAKTPEHARLPMTAKNDREALIRALTCCVRLDAPRIARIADTHHLEHLWVSEAVLAELEGCEVLQPPAAMCFDAAGNFSR